MIVDHLSVEICSVSWVKFKTTTLYFDPGKRHKTSDTLDLTLYNDAVSQSHMIRQTLAVFIVLLLENSTQQ